MFLIPIGHEKSAVRRLPWVTWSLCLACIGVFLMTDLEAAYQPSAKQRAFDEACDYFREHAYLRGDDALLDHIRYDVPPNQRGQYIEALRELAVLGAPETSEGIEAGRSPLEQAVATELGDFGGLTDTERLAGNLHVAYREAEAPGYQWPGTAVAIGDMVTFNGGQLPRCVA